MKILFFLALLANIIFFLWEANSGALIPTVINDIDSKKQILLVSELDENVDKIVIVAENTVSINVIELSKEPELLDSSEQALSLPLPLPLPLPLNDEPEQVVSLKNEVLESKPDSNDDALIIIISEPDEVHSSEHDMAQLESADPKLVVESDKDISISEQTVKHEGSLQGPPVTVLNNRINEELLTVAGRNIQKNQSTLVATSKGNTESEATIGNVDVLGNQSKNDGPEQVVNQKNEVFESKAESDELRPSKHVLAQLESVDPKLVIESDNDISIYDQTVKHKDSLQDWVTALTFPKNEELITVADKDIQKDHSTPVVIDKGTKEAKAIIENADELKNESNLVKNKTVKENDLVKLDNNHSELKHLTKYCFQVGAFKNKQTLKVWRKENLQQLDSVSIIKKEIDVISSYLVLFPAASTYEESKENVILLRNKGITDFWLFRKGKFKGNISLGLFQRESRALVLQQRFVKMGINAEITERYKKEEALYLQISSEDKDLKNTVFVSEHQKIMECK